MDRELDHAYLVTLQVFGTLLYALQCRCMLRDSELR